MLRGRRPRGLALPALVVWAGGGERRLEVVGDDPPSVDADGVWRASFTWEFESYVVYGARLVMGDGATVELPSPARGGRSRRHGARRARGGTAAVPLDEVRERAIVEARAEIERERASARHAIAQVEAERERKRQALARGRAELDRQAAALEEERRRLAELRTEVEEERRRLAARCGQERRSLRGAATRPTSAGAVRRRTTASQGTSRTACGWVRKPAGAGRARRDHGRARVVDRVLPAVRAGP